MNPTKEQKDVSSHICAIIGNMYYRDLDSPFIDDVIMDEIAQIPIDNLNRDKIEKACIIILKVLKDVNKRIVPTDEE